MSRILVLPDNVASRIAAGEVVERPASVVKELVENSIDAGALAIEIALEGGGRDAIVVGDDGEGMGADDILLALERHATSKIRSDSDIEEVKTLGFRGEAVPSIASVSRFRMTSRDTASDLGTSVEVQGGRIADVKSQPAPRGTRVEVMGLFYNAPARRKFLKSAETERQRIVEVISRFAIGYPGIRFRLLAEGRVLFDHAPVSDVLERCAQVLGRQLAQKLLPVRVSTGGLSLSGLCSGLDETRMSAREQHFFVNHRPVRDRLIAHAVSSAYAEALPRGRYPVLVLLIEVPSSQVDVNVHPSKSEVRFRRSGEVHSFLEGALRSILRSTKPFPSIAWGVAVPKVARAWMGTGSIPGAERVSNAASEARETNPVPYGFTGASADSSPSLPGTGGFAYAPASFPPRVPTAAPGGEAVAPLGQFLDSYILARDGDGLLIVDQHAAHERVLFERFMTQASVAQAPAQRLLAPVVIELASAELDVARQSSEALAAVGFLTEDFGPDTILLRGIPDGFEGVDPAGLVRNVLSDLMEGARPGEPVAVRRRVAASAACHAAIKVHFPLTAAKMAWLLEALFRCESPSACPHGRPTILRIEREDLERGFHRR